MYSNKKDNFQQDLLKIEIAKADLLKQEVDDSQFTVFDHATVQIVDQYKDTVEIETFRDAIKRIFELAGLNYELEKRRRKKDKGPQAPHCYRYDRIARRARGP
jgi:hypothetical protein